MISSSDHDEHDEALKQMRMLLSFRLIDAPLWFEKSDTDGNGILDRSEFQTSCVSLLPYVRKSVCDALFDEIDTNGSNGISQREYLSFIVQDTLFHKAESMLKVLWQGQLPENGGSNDGRFTRRQV